MDFQNVSWLRAAMDEDTIDLIVALCTRIGMIMEDTSVIALTLRGATEIQRHEAVADIKAASDYIAALVGAVQVLRD